MIRFKPRKAIIKRLMIHQHTFLFALILCSFMLAIPRFVVTAHADAFCLAIKEIIQSGQQKFKSVTGKIDLVSEENFGLVTPPELQDCFGWLNGKAYHCRTQDGLSEEEVALSYESYITAFQSCLTDQWQRKEANFDRVDKKRISTFTSDASPVKISIGERSKRHGWFVDFYFRS